MTKTYKLLSIRFILRVLFVALLICIFFLFTYLTVHTLKGFTNNNYKLGYIGLGFLCLNVYLIYYFGTIFLIFYKYVQNEKDRKITIDFENKNISILENREFNILDSNNLKLIEFNCSTLNSKNLLSEYDFVKFYTSDEREFIITNIIINSSKIDKLFPSIKRTVKFNKVNHL